jgi:DNA topoisomerase IB
MRLRRSTVGGPGLRRIRRGRGFCYVLGAGARGDSVDDPETLERIEALVIPPAWKNVWICPYPNGHIQDNGSFGLATLRRDHVRLHRGSVEFDYPAKSGVRRTVSLEDPLVIRAVRSLLRAETKIPRLLVYRTSDGWSEVHADDLNMRFRELVGEDFSVKDLRTWHGTVLAAEAFAIAREPTSKTARRREEAAVMRAVAEQLGNTPAVARRSYVDPRVVMAYEQGATIAPALRRAKRQRSPEARRETIEGATARMIRRVARG